MRKEIKKYQEFLNENNNETDNYIWELFRDSQYNPGYIEDDKMSGSIKKSLELIGDGEIIDKGYDHYMYKEMLYDNEYIFVVHGSVSTPVITEGYSYEIGLYKNIPSNYQIGGGYGASGIVGISHPIVFKYDTYQTVYFDHRLISDVCHKLKKNKLSELLNK